MKKAVWMVTRDDSWYLDMAIESVAKNVDGIFILDTGSKDATPNVVGELKQKYPNIVYEVRSFGGSRKFASDYREAEARNYAMDRAKQEFNPDWLIQLDSDEVYNFKFFDVLEKNPGASCIAHSTHLPTSPFQTTSYNRGDLSAWNGVQLFDPHVRTWPAKIPVRWVTRLGQHVIPRVEGKADYLDLPGRHISQEHIHFHLHRAFGPKCIATYLVDFRHAYEGAAAELKIPIEQVFNQKLYEEKWPDWFEDGKFKPKTDILQKLKSVSIKLTSPLPDFVIERWKEWGNWSNW